MKKETEKVVNGGLVVFWVVIIGAIVIFCALVAINLLQRIPWL